MVECRSNYWTNWNEIVYILLLVGLCTIYCEAIVVGTDHCSFFNNRAPKAQPGLKNCTWYQNNSCCLKQEIAATFGRVKPLKGASQHCQKYINYLMCYICAPNQNTFYSKERLTVCLEFCDKLYDACKSATLKGSIIGKLYPGGREFCESRRFQVATEHCFIFDEKLDTSHGTTNVASKIIVTLLLLFHQVFMGPHPILDLGFSPLTL